MSDKKQHLIGVLNKKSSNKSRHDCYTVSWEYACDALHQIDFPISIVYSGMSLYLRLIKKVKNYQMLH